MSQFGGAGCSRKMNVAGRLSSIHVAPLRPNLPEEDLLGPPPASHEPLVRGSPLGGAGIFCECPSHEGFCPKALPRLNVVGIYTPIHQIVHDGVVFFYCG